MLKHFAFICVVIVQYKNGMQQATKIHKKDGDTFRALRVLRGMGFGIKDDHFTKNFRLERHQAWPEIQIIDMSYARTTLT